MSTGAPDTKSLERLRWILGLVGLGIVASGVFVVLKPFLVPLAWAIVIVTSLWPLYRRLAKRIPGRPTLTAALMTGFIGLVVLGVVVPLLGTLSNEIAGGAKGARTWFESNRGGITPLIEQLPFIASETKALLVEQVNHLFGIQALVVELLGGYHTEIARVLGLAAKGVLTFVGKTIVCLVSAFFLFRHGEVLGRDLREACHRIGGDRFDRVLAAIKGSITGGVYGILATALAQGVLAGIGFAVAGAPVPVLLGLATMVISPVPFGSPLIYLPTALVVIVSSGSILPGLLLAAWGIGVVSTVDNILRPLFISQAISMNLLLVFFGVIGGILAFGFIGIFVGPAVLAIAQVLWHEWLHTDSKGAADNSAQLST
jgi:predicted PurR-regulated permease PerM